MIRLLDRRFVLKVLLLILFYSLLPIAEIFLLLYLRDYLGRYLILAIVASTGLVGLLIVYQQIRIRLREVKGSIDSGIYPRSQFVQLTGAFLSSALLLTPGFITDVFGVVLFMPVFRSFVGTFVVQKMEPRLKELYEYLKL